MTFLALRQQGIRLEAEDTPEIADRSRLDLYAWWVAIKFPGHRKDVISVTVE
ncbi:hypothetical protein N9C30_00280 [bacterium]|nr:hypothetical protein [bacterium]